MATSGLFNTSAYNKRRSVQFSWERTNYSLEGNYSDIHWQLKGGTVSSGSPSYYYLHACYLGITYKDEPGKEAYYHHTYENDDVNIQLTYNKLITEGNIRIYHDNEGNATFSVGVSAGIYTYAVNVSGNQSFVLDNLPRSTACPDISGTIGTSVAAYISGASPNFTHSLLYTFGNLTGSIPINTAWIIPKEFYNQIPDSKSGEGTLTLITYNNGSEIGRKSGKLYAYCEENDCKPLGSGTIIALDEKTINQTEDETKIIKGISTALINFEVTPKNGATIKSLSINGTSLSSDVRSVQIFNSQFSKYILHIEDSRGISSDIVIGDDSNLINYIPLSANVQIVRNSSTSDKVTLSIDGNIFNGNFGNEDNNLEIKWRVKDNENDFSDMQFTTFDILFYGNSFGTSQEIENPLSSDKKWDYRKSYTFELYLKDNLVEIYKSIPLRKGIPNHNWYEKNDINYFNVNGNILVSNKNIFELIYPIGIEVTWHDTLDHSSWLDYEWELVSETASERKWKRKK